MIYQKAAEKRDGIQNLKNNTKTLVPPPTSTIHTPIHSSTTPNRKQFFFISPSTSLRLYQAMRPQNPKTPSSLRSKSKKPTGSDASFPSMNNKSEQKTVATHQSLQPPLRTDGAAAEEGSCFGRERLKRHWVDVAGRVWIPDIWGQEDLLKDWIDCSAFDSSLVGSSIMSARQSLVEEGRRASSTRFGIENSC